MIQFILQNISGHAWVHAGTERMLAYRTQTSGRDIRRYCFWWGVWWDSTQLDANFLGYVLLLAELKPAVGTSGVTASGEGYDETLHRLMQTFWDIFNLGQITQTVTCSICTCVTTRADPFSKLLVQFPDSHHDATLTNQKCTLNSLIQHHFEPKDLPDCECLTCGRGTLATQRVRISYPVILWIVLGCKMNDETRITLAVNYPVINLNLCIFLNHMKERWTQNTTSFPP